MNFVFVSNTILHGIQFARPHLPTSNRFIILKWIGNFSSIALSLADLFFRRFIFLCLDFMTVAFFVCSTGLYFFVRTFLSARPLGLIPSRRRCIINWKMRRVMNIRKDSGDAIANMSTTSRGWSGPGSANA